MLFLFGGCSMKSKRTATFSLVRISYHMTDCHTTMLKSKKRSFNVELPKYRLNRPEWVDTKGPKAYGTSESDAQCVR